MNPEIKEQWISALRSGDYVQGTGWLRSADNKYCCLGVLCELAVGAGVITCNTVEWSETFYQGNSTVLPIEVEKWAEIGSCLGSFEGMIEGTCSLAHLNDSGFYDFSQIANVIEEKF